MAAFGMAYLPPIVARVPPDRHHSRARLRLREWPTGQRSAMTQDQRLSIPEETTTAPVLSVIVPSYNERPNVWPMIARLDKALRGIDWEVIYVDDNSPDRTA